MSQAPNLWHVLSDALVESHCQTFQVLGRKNQQGLLLPNSVSPLFVLKSPRMLTRKFNAALTLSFELCMDRIARTFDGCSSIGFSGGGISFMG